MINLGLWESYKRFIKHGFVWYCGHESWLQKGLIRDLQNKSWIHVVSWITNPTLKDLFWIMNHESSQFSKIQPVFTNSTNPHESTRILSIIVQNKSFRIQICRLANPDWGVQTIQICIADSICRPVFKRFVSWIRFVRPKISNYSICINSEGLVWEFRKHRSHIFRSNTFLEKTFNFQKFMTTWESIHICIKIKFFLINVFLFL